VIAVVGVEAKPTWIAVVQVPSRVQIVEGKMRELFGEGKQAGGKILSALVKQVDEPTKNENKWKRVFEIERWKQE